MLVEDRRVAKLTEIVKRIWNQRNQNAGFGRNNSNKKLGYNNNMLDHISRQDLMGAIPFLFLCFCMIVFLFIPAIVKEIKNIPKFRIVKEFRNRNSRLAKPKYYIQRRWLWMWHDIIPYGIDSVFYGRGWSWDTLEEALEIYHEIEEVLKVNRKEPEVVWPKPEQDSFYP